jgi:hypothetical protein
MTEGYDVTSLVRSMDDSNELLNSNKSSDVERAYQFLKFLAAIGKDSPETLYKVYASGVDVPPTILYAVTSYFEGAGHINIVCDCYDGGGFCEKPNHFNNQSYDNGLGHLDSKDIAIEEVAQHIENIRQLFR